MTMISSFSVHSIVDSTRNNIPEVMAHYDEEEIFDTFLEERTYDWGKDHVRFLQYQHPDLLAKFVREGGKLNSGTRQDREYLYHILGCNSAHPCNADICPLCQLAGLEEADSAAAPRP